MSALVPAACQPLPPGVMAEFRPGHAVFACPPSASPWSWLGTETPLWVYLCVVAFIALVSFAASWLKDHYELAAGRPARRWYGTGAWVTLRCDAGLRSPGRWAVTAWSDEAAGVPWLLASPVDDEDAEAFWAPVTDFGPFAVRRFRPHLWRGWIPVPFARETLPRGTS